MLKREFGIPPVIIFLLLFFMPPVSHVLASEPLLVESNQDPILSDPYVDPDPVGCDELVRYLIKYTDADGHSASVSRVYIDGVAHDMTAYVGSDPQVGITYLFQISGRELGGECHDYFFHFEDGHGGSAVYPEISSYPGPCVTSAPDIQVSPLSLDFDASLVTTGEISTTTETSAMEALDLSDPTAELGQVSRDHLVVRFRAEKAARMHARRLVGRNGPSVQWEAQGFDFMPGELPDEIGDMRPFSAGMNKARKLVERDKAFSYLRSRGGGVGKEKVERISRRLVERIMSNGPMGLFLARIAKGEDPREISLRLMQHRDVVYAHPSPICQVQSPPNDPLYDRMWHLHRIGTELAWDVAGNTLGDIRVCVIDTGVRLTHSDFAGRIAYPKDVYLGNGDAYADTDPDNDDEHGHGTKCAGIIGAVRDNGERIAGIAPVTIIPVNSHSGGNSISNYTEGVYWGVDHGARIISMSFGDDTRSAPYQSELDASAYAEAHDVLLCAAAGNKDNHVDNNYPSAIPYYISVSAVDDDNLRVTQPKWGWGSNYGDTVDICAPGQGDVGVYSDSILTLDSDSDTDWVQSFNGTSAATPHVAGLCALLAHVNPLLTGSQIRTIIETTAQDQVGDPAEDVAGWDPYHGHGLINALDAVLAAAETTARAFTISNNGCGDALTITSIDKEYQSQWLSFEPQPPFEIEPGTSQQVIVTIDASGLNGGTYSDRLLVYSDDPEQNPYADGVYVNVTITCDLPLITVEPTDVTVDEGQDATFSVTATSDEPLTYSWTMNGVVVGDNSPTVAIYGAGEEDNGSEIICEISNVCGSVFSRTAVLSVIDTCPPDFDDDGDVDGADLASFIIDPEEINLSGFAGEFWRFGCSME